MELVVVVGDWVSGGEVGCGCELFGEWSVFWMMSRSYMYT
jgi:hypothetical protein